MVNNLPRFFDEIDEEHPDNVTPQCMNCVWRVGFSTCRAFPNGIPVTILTNVYDHRQPYPGDRDIRYRAVDQRIIHPSAKKSPGTS